MDVSSISNSIMAATALIGTTIALQTFRHQARTRQFEALIPIRERIEDLTKGMDFIALLQEDDADLAKIPFETRANILGWLEVASTALTSGSISEELAFNFFGFYAIAIRRSTNFRHDLPESSVYWMEFHSFTKRMERVEQRKAKSHLKPST